MKIVKLSKLLKKTNKLIQSEYMISLGKDMFLKTPEKPIEICHVNKLKQPS